MRITFGLMIVVLAAANIGCVERRMTIRSNPSNALVVLDGQEIGFTPISVPYHYVGTRQIKLVKDGFETKVVNQTVAPKWHDYIGLDFVAEVMLPVQIRDERDYTYNLEPRVMVPQDQFLERGQQVRMEAQNPPPKALERAKVQPADYGVPPPAVAQKAGDAPK